MGIKLKKFLLRYYPPGVILQYEKDGQTRQKPVDLLDLSPDSNTEARTPTKLCARPPAGIPGAQSCKSTVITV
jgi:hypothetical protein